jgi:DNA/RNA endonuclease G (NUC1)
MLNKILSFLVASVFVSHLFLTDNALAFKLSGVSPSQPASYCLYEIYNLRLNSGQKRFQDKVISDCRKAYMSYFDTEARIPLVVYYKVDKNKVLGCAKRAESFRANPYINSSVDPSIYKKSGFDKGHMAPSSDMAWSLEIEEESYLTTNIVPQLPNFNRGLWRSLESAIRNHIITSNEDFIVIVGSLYNKESKLLKNKVVIPDAFFKILINEDKKTIRAWKIQHKAFLEEVVEEHSLNNYRVTINDLQRNIYELQGYRLAIPPTYQEEGLMVGLQGSTSFYNKTKQQKCH